MNAITIIISAVVFIAIGWILYFYSVRRARFLVRQQLASLSEKKAENEKTIDAEHIYQIVDTDRNSKNTHAGEKTKPYEEKPNLQEKPPIPSDERRWAMLN